MVLVMVAIMSIVAVGGLFLAQAEVTASAASAEGLQARAAAMSGIYRAVAVLGEAPAAVESWYDNPDLFQDQPLVADDADGWRFTIFADNPADPANPRYGLEDEAGKISLNTADADTLTALGLTTEQADCLLDYVDREDPAEVRPQGAEQEYYDALPRPYRIKNGPLSTLEEVLLVKGFSGRDVFGEDANRNGLFEPNEDDGDESFPPDDRDGRLDRGLRAVATPLAYEPDVAADGSPRVNINAAGEDEIRALADVPGLGEELVTFLLAARKQKVRFPDPSALLEMRIEVEQERRGRGGRRFTVKRELSSGITADNLDAALDQLTAGGVQLMGRQMLIGRVNVHTAPREVLAAVPGLDGETADRIITARGELDSASARTVAWLYTQNILSRQAFKKVAPRLTARGFQYRVRSFGYRPGGGRFCVLEAVVDLAGGEPRIRYLRRLTRLGVPLTPIGQER
jgi:hypothetical protein